MQTEYQGVYSFESLSPSHEDWRQDRSRRLTPRCVCGNAVRWAVCGRHLSRGGGVRVNAICRAAPEKPRGDATFEQGFEG